jgi:hypothetical protein
MTTIHDENDLLDRVPKPAAIQRRLTELLREERILRSLMSIALRADEERRRRSAEEQPPGAA